MKEYEELKGKAVLVTGGTQGIGEAVAECFAREGASVMINGRKRNEKVEAVLRRTGAEAVMGDVGNPAEAARIVEEAFGLHGRLDVLVANAAGMSMGPFLEQDEDSWWSQIHINLTGHIACIKVAVEKMKAQGGGAIIIIGSFFGTIGWKNATGYGASKSGLLTLGQHLARKYEKDNIRVCVLIPGVIDTPQLNVDAGDLGITLDEVRQMYAEDIAMGRLGKPEEIGEMTLFMATDNGGRALSGRHIQVSGGEYRTTPYYL